VGPDHSAEELAMPRRAGNLTFSLNQLLVIVALILTVLDLLNIGLRGIPLLPLAVLLLCIAWLVP
jgi:hypothetical protein